MSTVITPETNPALHATLQAKYLAEVVGWEKPSSVMNGGTQYTVSHQADETVHFILVSSEIMHDSTSGMPGSEA